MGFSAGTIIALETLPPRQDLSDQVDPSGPLASDRPSLHKRLAAAHLTSDLCVCVCVLVHVCKSELRAGRIPGKAIPSIATFTAKKKKILKIQKSLYLGRKEKDVQERWGDFSHFAFHWKSRLSLAKRLVWLVSG